MAKKKPKTNNNVIWIVVAIAVFAWGGSQGWFKSDISIGFPSNINPFDFDKPAAEIVPVAVPGLVCTFEFDKSTACVGENVRGTIHDGELQRCVVASSFENGPWNIYNFVNLDINGDYSEVRSADIAGSYRFAGLCGSFTGDTFFPQCRTNNAEIEIINCDDDEPSPPPAEDEGLQPGDVVGTGEGNFIIGDEGLSTFEIQLTPGDNQADLCAEIERRSSKVDPNCNPVGELEDWSIFVFLDSFENVWERNDQIFAGMPGGPNTFGNPDVVPVRWDGVTPFRGFLDHVGSCVMDMSMRVTIKVC